MSRPRLSLPDDIGEVTREHPVTLERLRQLNAPANAPTTRRQSLQSKQSVAIDADVEMTDAVPDQAEMPAPPRPQTRSTDEHASMTTVQQSTAMQQASSPFVVHIMAKLQHKLDRIIRLASTRFDTDEQKSETRSLYTTDGLYALRQIYTAWSIYPQAGGSFEGAIIHPVDFRFTAQHVVKNFNLDSFPRKIAKFIGNTIDPEDFDGTVVHMQMRIDEHLLALKKQYLIWRTQLEPTVTLTDDDLHLELTTANASPITYRMQPPVDGLSERSTTIQMMRSEALAAAAEDEMHDNVHIFVTDKVLSTKAAKSADLARQLGLVRAEEANKAAAEKAAAKAEKKAAVKETPKNSNIKGRTTKKTVLFTSSNHEDTDDLPAPTPARTPAKAPNRKRLVSAVDGADDDAAEGPAKVSTPRKKAKKAGAKAKVPDDSSEMGTSTPNDRSSGTPQLPGSVAPENAKRGGAAPKWLKDEDDLGKQLVIDHPDWQMPEIYREFNRQLANTAYQTDKMKTLEYRADWVEFPRHDVHGNAINDKSARKLNICWRTYESVRQHLEKHKAKVNNSDEPRPITWKELTANPVAHLPKRTPPPRPTYFKDGKTLVDRLPDEYLADDSELPTDDTPTSTFQEKKYVTTSGWTPINKLFGRTLPTMSSSPVPPKKRRTTKPKAAKDVPQTNTSTPAQPLFFMEPETPMNPGHLKSPSDAEEKDDDSWMNDLPPVEQSAPGDAKYDTLEDSVNDQSDGEEGDDEDDDQDAPAPQGPPTRLAATSSTPAISQLPPAYNFRTSGLPYGWERRYAENGRPYYVDHANQRTTWMHPGEHD